MAASPTLSWLDYQALPPDMRKRPLTSAEYASLTKQQRIAAGLDDEDESAPADFNGPVFPNPDHLRPQLDTDAAVPVTRLPEGVTFQKENFSGSPQMDVSNPATADVLPAMGREIATKMSAQPVTPQQDWFDQNAPKSAAASGDWFDQNAPKTAAPEEKRDQFAQDKATTEAWAQNHPILGPIARFLVSGGQNAANAITETPGQLYHAIIDPPTVDEAALTPEQRIAFRLGGKQAIEAGQDYAGGKVSPKAAVSVLPEALGTGVGQVAGGAVYGKAGELAPDLARGAAAATADTAKAAVSKVGSTASAVGESLDPDLVGLVSPRAAHALRLASKVGKVANKLSNAAAPAAVYPGAPLPENPGVFPGAPYPTATLEQLNPSLVSPSRSLPGQIGPEIIRPPVQPAAPIPARTGLALPPGPPEAAAAPRTLSSLSGDVPAAKATASVRAPLADLQQQINDALGGKPLQRGIPLRNQGAAVKLPEGFTPVESSVVKGYKYDAGAQQLTTVTKTGQSYTHAEVTPEEAQAFIDADSKGKAWNTIRDNHVQVQKNGMATKPVASRSADPAATTPETPAPKTTKPRTLKDLSGSAANPVPTPTGDDLTSLLQKSLDQVQKKPAGVAKGTYDKLIDDAMKEGPAWTPEKAEPIVTALNKNSNVQFEARGSVGEGRSTSNDLDLWQKSGELKDAAATLKKLGFKRAGKTPHGETWTNGAQHIDLWDSEHEPIKGYTGAKVKQ